MSKVLVVGGAGYIGSHVAKQLVRLGHSVLNFDNLSTGFEKLLQYGEFYRGCLLEPKEIQDCIQTFQPEAVFHFANLSCVMESVENPGLYYRNNIGGTLNLLDAMVSFSPKVPLVFSSSCAVYGEPQGELSEDHPQNPVNPYGHTKKIVEEIISQYHHTHKIPFAALRYFNAAGADSEGELGELHEPETHLIPRVLQLYSNRNQGKVCIFGNDYNTPDGTCIRDFIHVEDLARAHIMALEHLQKNSGSLLLNLGSGKGYSVLEVIKAIGRITDNCGEIPIGPRRAGDPEKLVAAPGLALQLWNWKPKHSLDSIIKSAWDWNVRQ